MKFLLSHPTINANWRHLSLAVAEAGWLGEFHTTLAWSADSRWLTSGPAAVRAELGRRKVDPQVAPYLRLHPIREACRIIATRFGWSSLLAHETGRCSIDAVYQELSQIAARRIGKIGNVSDVIAGEDGAFHLFRAAESAGIRRVYELPIGFFEAAQRLYAAEAERLPAWRDTLPGLDDSPAKLERKRAEVEMASKILVAIPFVERTLVEAGIDASRIHVVPYGCASVSRVKRWEAGWERRSLRVLFAGSLTQRKGLYEFLTAARNLKDACVEFVVMGSVVGSGQPLREFDGCFRYEPPRPHEAVLELMRACDVFVLPSLFEGSGLVITEAMACGLPVIATPHTCANPVVRDGVDGFVVPIRDADTLTEKIAYFARNREAVVAMGTSARQRTAEFSWERYRAGIRSALNPTPQRRHPDSLELVA